jgi:small-conductance mechanosensitive channel
VHAQSLTPSLQAILIQLLKIFLPVIAVLVVLPVMGVSLTALTVFGGALAVGLGLGLQRTAANLVSGLALLMGGSIRPGDVIALRNTVDESHFGQIVSIGVGYVAVRTRSGVEHLLPNEQLLTNGVENWSHTNDRKIRLKVPFGISYESDLHQAIALAIEAAQSVDRVQKSPKPVCLVTGFGESSVNLELRFWVDDPMLGVANVKSACMLALWDRFQAAGIVFPFPRREVRILPPEESPPIS